MFNVTSILDGRGHLRALEDHAFYGTVYRLNANTVHIADPELAKIVLRSVDFPKAGLYGFLKSSDEVGWATTLSEPRKTERKVPLYRIDESLLFHVLVYARDTVLVLSLIRDVANRSPPICSSLRTKTSTVSFAVSRLLLSLRLPWQQWNRL